MTAFSSPTRSTSTARASTCCSRPAGTPPPLVGSEPTSGGGVPAGREQHVDALAVLVDRVGLENAVMPCELLLRLSPCSKKAARVERVQISRPELLNTFTEIACL